MISTQDRGLLICARDLASRSSNPIQQCKLKTIGCYFVNSGPRNTSLSNAVKMVAVLRYHPHEVVAFYDNDENGHVSSHFQAMRSDGSTMIPLSLLSLLTLFE